MPVSVLHYVLEHICMVMGARFGAGLILFSCFSDSFHIRLSCLATQRRSRLFAIEFFSYWIGSDYGSAQLTPLECPFGCVFHLGLFDLYSRFRIVSLFAGPAAHPSNSFSLGISYFHVSLANCHVKRNLHADEAFCYMVRGCNRKSARDTGGARGIPASFYVLIAYNRKSLQWSQIAARPYGYGGSVCPFFVRADMETRCAIHNLDSGRAYFQCFASDNAFTRDALIRIRGRIGRLS